ncbi:MAG: nitrilase-related carbon-nitrogen hydrolase, partial [Kofleriaceae bacterium]
MRLIKVAVACVNQTPFAWDENFAHLRQAIDHARAEGVSMLCLPELAITGYGCEDAFFMDGLQDLAFQQLDQLAQLTEGMVVAVGLPVYHEKALYNAAALLANGEIVGFVAKQFL